MTCELCEREQQIGRQLPQSRHVAFVPNAQIPGVTSAPLGGFRLLRRQDRPAGHELLVVDLDGRGDGHPADPVFGAYRARYIPIAAETGTPVEFSDLAHRSQGCPGSAI